VPVGLSSINEYGVSGGYNTSRRKEQTTFLDSSLEKIKEKIIINDENKSYVYVFELMFSIDGELESFFYIGRSGTRGNLFARFNTHFKNMRDRTEGKPIKQDSPNFEKCGDHFEKCKLVRLIVNIEPVAKGKGGVFEKCDPYCIRENELIAAHASKYGIEYILNKQGRSSDKQSLMPQASRDKLSRQNKGNSLARGHSRRGKCKGREKSLEEKAKISKTTRKANESRQFKVTYKNGKEEKIHRSDCKEKLGITYRHARKKAERMTLGHPNYDESFQLGIKKKGPQNSVHHKLSNKGIVKIEFDGKWGSLKKQFCLKHKDTGEITSYESITDGLKKIKCRDGEPVCKAVLQKIVGGQRHGDDVKYFPYTLFIEGKDQS
jgi:hypothetical protein